jgi:hypothetical protein
VDLISNVIIWPFLLRIRGATDVLSYGYSKLEISELQIFRAGYGYSELARDVLSYDIRNCIYFEL